MLRLANKLNEYESEIMRKLVKRNVPIVTATNQNSPAFSHRRGVILYIPEGAVALEDGAFEGCRGITKVHFPSSLTKIGARAFEGCTGITDLQFSDKSDLVEIRAHAFDRCTKL